MFIAHEKMAIGEVLSICKGALFSCANDVFPPPKDLGVLVLENKTKVGTPISMSVPIVVISTLFLDFKAQI